MKKKVLFFVRKRNIIYNIIFVHKHFLTIKDLNFMVSCFVSVRRDVWLVFSFNTLCHWQLAIHFLYFKRIRNRKSNRRAFYVLTWIKQHKQSRSENTFVSIFNWRKELILLTNAVYGLTRRTKDKHLSTSDFFDFSRERIIDVLKRRRVENVI